MPVEFWITITIIVGGIGFALYMAFKDEIFIKNSKKGIDAALNKSYSPSRNIVVTSRRKHMTIRKRYQFVKTSAEGKDAVDTLRQLYSDAHAAVLELAPESKRRDQALFDLEASFLWASKAVSRANAVEVDPAD